MRLYKSLPWYDSLSCEIDNIKRSLSVLPMPLFSAKTNRWRFMQRKITAEPPGKDFTSWDLPDFSGNESGVSESVSCRSAAKGNPGYGLE